MPYDFKYLGNRQYDIIDRDPGDVDDCFRVLRKTFLSDWLDTTGANVLQTMWKIPYALAAKELFALGHAIRNLDQIDSRFIQSKVKAIKSGDSRNAKGALFEILALNLFTTYNRVEPATDNQPGYDGTIHLQKGKSLRLSIKNYSVSAHQDNYLKHCEHLAELTRQYIQEFNCVPIEVVINKKSEYPTDAEWQNLFANFHGVFIEYNKIGKHWVSFNIEDWAINVQEIVSNDGQFSAAAKSFTLIVSGPFHKNEEKNLFDKLEEACVNLAKHERLETEDIKNFIVIHLPEIASRESCAQWVIDYFEQFPDKPISGVILLQPLVLRKGGENNTEYISIGISTITRENFQEDFSEILPLMLATPVGALEDVLPTHKITIRQTDTTALEIILKNCYVYQHGHHYYDAVINSEGEAEGHVDKVASGIFKHMILYFNGQAIALSGQFEPVDRLSIL